MNIINKILTIRNATTTDAEQLCIWWNDGKVMEHAGFPNGLNETPEKICESLASDTDETHRRHMIELSGSPIGEMNYRDKGNKTAEIGIKICDFNMQGKGYGTTLLTMFINTLFTYYGYDKIILDTNVKNERAQNVYEKKLGFRRIGIRENSWRNQLGELQSSIDYDLKKDDWFATQKEPPQYIHIRLETPAHHHAVEEMTREAFWRFWESDRKICDEHFLVHKLRNSQAFVPELNYIAEVDGRLAGHIIYTKSRIEDDAGKCHETLTFGPLTVLPEFQGKGVGKALMRHTFDEARRLGYRAVIILGHPDYYPQVGFRRAAEFNITTADGKTFDPFMALPLYDGALDGICGRYYIDAVYEQLNQKDVLEFDKRFPPKKPHTLTAVSVLLDRLDPDAAKAVEGLDLPSLDAMRAKSEREISVLPGIDRKAIDTIRTVMTQHNYQWGKSKGKSYRNL